MFSIFSINNETEFYPHSFNPELDLPNNHPMKLFFSKHKKPKEEVVFENGFEEYKPTLPELLSFLLIRMAGRFTADELPYFCTELGRDPTYDQFEGQDKFYSSTLAIRNHLKAWKKQFAHGVSPLTKEEINTLETELEDLGAELTPALQTVLKQDPTPTGAEIVHFLDTYESVEPLGANSGSYDLGYVFNISDYEKGRRVGLAHVVGVVSVGEMPSNLALQAVMIDTGATQSILNHRHLSALGLHEANIDISYRPPVCTASRGIIQSEGYIHARLYLRDGKHQFPFLNVSFLVISSDNLPPLVLGHGELLAGKYLLGHLHDTPASPYALHIAAFLPEAKQPHRAVIPVINAESFELVNVNHVKVMTGGDMSSAIFETSAPLPATPGARFKLVSTNPDCTVLSEGDVADLVPSDQICLSDNKTLRATSQYTVPVSPTKELKPGELKLFMSTQPSPAPLTLDEMDLIDLAKLFNTEGVSWEENEAYILDHISSAPDYFEPPPDGVMLPDLSHLPTDVRAKFDQMFRANIDLLSQHQYDIGSCTFPPVHIATYPGVTCQDQPRGYDPVERGVMKEYIDNLLAAGIVEEVTVESPWNHNINLVGKSVDGSQKLDRSGHGMTKKEMLVKHGARFTSDLRNINAALPEVKMTSLPKFIEVLPLLTGKTLATFDIRAGYFSVHMDDESKDIFSFQFENRYFRYLRLVQGFKNSVAIFNNLMARVFDRSAWDKYRAQHEEIKHLPFEQTFSIYLDDLIIAAPDINTLFFCVEFACICVKHAGLKLHPKKIQIDCETMEVLGFEINTKRGTFKMASKRSQAFITWMFPRSRAAVISRIASCQYFNICLPAIKHVLFALTLLAKSKHDKFYIKTLHKREFLAMKLLAAMQIEMHLPNLDEPLFASSDASFSSYAGCIMQKQYLQLGEGKFSKEKHLVMCGAVSKNFKQVDLQRAIWSKETMALIECLRSFNYWIRGSICTVFSTDCKALEYIARLRHQDSKMFSAALFLASYGRIYFVHSRGSHFLVSAADLLSRGLQGSEILSPAGVPKEFLECISTDDYGKLIVDPETLHRIMTGPAPSYSNIPYRKKQRPCPDMLEFNEDQIFNSPTPEAEVITALFNGYDSIKPDTIAFKNEKTNRKMSKTDFSQLETKYNLPNIRKFIEINTKHQNCAAPKAEKLHNIFLINHELEDTMVIKLKEFLQRKKKKTFFTRKLLDLCYVYLKHPKKSHSLVRDIINTFLESEFAGDTDGPKELIRYLTAEQASTSEVVLTPAAGSVQISNKFDLQLDPGQLYTIKVFLRIASKFEIEFRSNVPNLAVTVNQTEGLIHTVFTTMILFHEESQSLHLPAGTVLGELWCHGEGSPCACSEPMTKGLLLDVISDLDFRAQTAGRETLDSRIMLFNAMTTVTESVLDQPVSQTLLKENLGNVIYPVCQDSARLPGITRRDLNHILLLSNLVVRGKVLTHDTIRQFQSSCAFLMGKLKGVREGTETDFVIENGLLFKKKQILGTETLLLCLDNVTFEFLVMSLHQQNYHYSDQVFRTYLGSIFFAVNSNEAIRRAKQNCGACFFNRRCSRRKVVVANNLKPEIGARWSSDLIENIERDKNGYKYICLLVEARTTFCIAFPLKTTRCKEFTQKLEPFLPLMMASEIITDFGTLYRGPELKHLLDRYNIRHEKSIPVRPEQNGLSEVTAKEMRNHFKTFVQGLPPSARDYWSEHLYFSTMTYNCGIIYAGDQQLTRYNLFHNSERSVNGQFLTTLNGSAKQKVLMQAECQRIIDARRERNRSGYDSSGLKPFTEGQLVILVSNKSEMQQAHPSSGLEPNSGKIFRVIRVSDSGLGVRCQNLLNGDLQTFDNTKLAPLDADLLCSGFGFDPTIQHSFEKSLFRRGRGNMVLQALKNSSQDLLLPEYDPVDDDTEERPQTSDPDLEEEWDHSTDQQTGDSASAPHGYNLRHRPARVNVVSKARKTVTFSTKEPETFYYLPSLDCGGDQVRLLHVQTLPAFRRDCPGGGVRFNLTPDTIWTDHGVDVKPDQGQSCQGRPEH